MRCPWCSRVVVDGVKGRNGPFEIDAQGGDFDFVARVVGARDGDEVRFGNGVGREMERALRAAIDAEGGDWDFVAEVVGAGRARVRDWVRAGDRAGRRAVGVLLGFVAVCVSASNGYDRPFAFILIGSHLLTFVGVMHRIDKHPRFGAVLILLGVCVGSWGASAGWWLLGRALLELGKVPFDKKIVKAYEQHPWEVVAVATTVQVFLLLQAVLGVKLPGGEMIELEAEMQMLYCVTFWIFIRLRRAGR